MSTASVVAIFISETDLLAQVQAIKGEPKTSKDVSPRCVNAVRHADFLTYGARNEMMHDISSPCGSCRRGRFEFCPHLTSLQSFQYGFMASLYQVLYIIISVL